MNPREKKLLNVFRELPENSQEQLADFAEYLLTKTKAKNDDIPVPKYIPPTEGESVVGALKRLSASYPMLDKAKLLNDTSILVSQHVMQGRDKGEVIQELEIVFQRHFQRFIGIENGDD